MTATLPLDHEELVVRAGPRSGISMAIAVHSTTLGPALGGVRIWRYASTADGVDDALRLAAAMTMKAAAAGLDLGGGKGVICLPSGPLTSSGREALLLDFGDLVESLGGRYITAEDVGSSARDLVTIARRTRHLTGLPRECGGSGDPSPMTARGVEAAMRACARERYGSASLDGARIAIVGLGNVGSSLARRLVASGAKLIVSDIDGAKRALAGELDAEWVDPGGALAAGCDILAPCALGGAIDQGTISTLACEIVCGAANNQLADEEIAETLAAHSILYAPDFIANAGGLISVSAEFSGREDTETLLLVDSIEQTTQRIFAIAVERSLTPLAAAAELAAERFAATEILVA